jgi:hypothetical protein
VPGPVNSREQITEPGAWSWDTAALRVDGRRGLRRTTCVRAAQYGEKPIQMSDRKPDQGQNSRKMNATLSVDRKEEFLERTGSRRGVRMPWRGGAQVVGL